VVVAALLDLLHLLLVLVALGVEEMVERLHLLVLTELQTLGVAVVVVEEIQQP
jgi:hypothetical protein